MGNWLFHWWLPVEKLLHSCHVNSPFWLCNKIMVSNQPFDPWNCLFKSLNEALIASVFSTGPLTWMFSLASWKKLPHMWVYIRVRYVMEMTHFVSTLSPSVKLFITHCHFVGSCWLFAYFYSQISWWKNGCSAKVQWLWWPLLSWRGSTLHAFFDRVLSDSWARCFADLIYRCLTMCVSKIDGMGILMGVTCLSS